MPEALAAPGEPAQTTRLLADVGATFARLCVELEDGSFAHARVLRCDEHAGFTPLVHDYLATLPPGLAPRHGAVAIATPVEGDRVRMTNRDWSFSIAEAQRELGLATLLVVNNFTAVAMALPRLRAGDRRPIGGGEAERNGVIGLLGPGTGLGVSGVVPIGDRWATLATEGGHVGFAPSDGRELRVLQYAWRTMPRVSAERLLSGPGLELIHRALGEGRRGKPAAPRSAAEIVAAAHRGDDPLCAETVDCFCAMLGAMAGDLALTLGAKGGIYIGGGIVPRLGELLDRSPFRARFEAKGRFAGWIARIPTFVLRVEDTALRGLSTLLAEHVVEGERAGIPLLARVRSGRDALSPSERRVADYVLENPRGALNEPIAAIARSAEVSQPTVIRFCRSLGFEGLADFKLKLGSGLTGALPVQRTQVRRQDGTGDLCAKVLDNTISAIVQLRESMNVEAVERAIALLRMAPRIELFAIGNSAVVALDAQHKLFRLRLRAVAHTDPSTLPLAADLLEPGDIALFISSSGQPAELVRAAGLAIERGAHVIAVTAGSSPLARKATLTIPIEHSEDTSAFVSMVSRILHLLALDMLTVGLALRQPEAEPGPATADPRSADAAQSRPAPGVLISHMA